MSFIELTAAHNRQKITVAVEHIASFQPLELTHIGNRPEESRKEIQTRLVTSAGGSFSVLEDYDQVRRLVGLDWLTCGETFQGDICDRRLDKQGRCPIHGMVGA